MSDIPVNSMDFKQLRNEVQLLRDELALFKRKYEDVIYNLDDDNFSGRFIKEKNDMKAEIKLTDGRITAAVSEVHKDVSDLRSEVGIASDSISAFVRGEYTEDILNNYFTGLVLSRDGITMTHNEQHSVYNEEGLRFYDSAKQVEGWAIEPDSSYGGVLNYYVNDGLCYTLGTGESGDGYSSTDMVLKSKNGYRDRFVVDVSGSGNKEIKFVGLSYSSENAPYIYANGKLLATQSWVLANVSGSGGIPYAVFG